MHIDVFGLVPVLELGKYVYYVSFIDDLSRNKRIYFLWNKFEIIAKFKEFKAIVDNQSKKNDLWALQRKGMVKGMIDCTLAFDFYEHCIYGKHNWVRFAFGATRAKEILELIHSDLFGPFHVPSLGKSMYYVSFIDDFSMNTWIYFIKRNMRYSKNSKSSRLL